MRNFTDNKGGNWSINITVREVKELRAIGIDIMAQDGSGIAQLAGDVEILVNALYCLCKKQADEKGVSADDFLSLFGGDSIEAAVNAMMEAVADFFPSARKKVLNRALEKAREVEAEIIENVMQKMDSEFATNLPELSA